MKEKDLDEILFYLEDQLSVAKSEIKAAEETIQYIKYLEKLNKTRGEGPLMLIIGELNGTSSSFGSI